MQDLINLLVSKREKKKRDKLWMKVHQVCEKKKFFCKSLESEDNSSNQGAKKKQKSKEKVLVYLL
jgi:NhaP-type Na+/H+ and K+/H+ antiporter